MDRRQFQRHALVAASGLAFSGCTAQQQLTKASKQKTILPARLKSGDTVGIIAPASSFPPERIPKTEENMAALGLNVKWGKNINAQRGYLAGTDEERLTDLHDMFRDQEVNAVWCIRGGYGCTRLLNKVDYKLIKRNPKVFIGFSDITALHLAIYQQTGLVTFHGPVGSSTFSDYTKEHVEQMLFNGSPLTIHQAEDYLTNDAPAFDSYVIQPGKATGELIGGNLSLLSAMCGTRYVMDVRGRILFIEDIGEKPYRIDRMLTQLRQNYPLNRAAGIALGIFSGCEAAENDKGISLRNTMRDRLGDLGIPVAYGFSFGHIDDQCTLPIGVKVQMDTARMTLTSLEKCVSD